MDNTLVKTFFKVGFIFSITLLASSLCGQDKYPTFFEESHEVESATYEETIGYYKKLARNFEEVTITTHGITDSGEPLHLILFSPDKVFEFDKIKAQKKVVMLIMNGIHPGEPDGVDASMLLLRDLLTKKRKITYPKNTVLAIIPFYNIGGALNRNSTSRANQNGPTTYGFRGNARNYDLNRDFIKQDTKNARSFVQLYHALDPDVFVDTHVSNGADYQHVISLISSPKDKMDKELAAYQETALIPGIFKAMERNNFPLTPYVNVFGTTPDNGFPQFMDYPRYSSGYVSLFGTLGFMTETHMLKPYYMRVKATYQFLWEMLEVVDKDAREIIELRNKAKESIKSISNYTLEWEIDSTLPSYINFLGYDAREVPSKVTGLMRLYYDKNSPFEKEIPYYNTFKPVVVVDVPKAYVVPKAWFNIIGLLKLNGVEMQSLKGDTVLTVEQYKVERFETTLGPYEGHYMHFNTQVVKQQKEKEFSKGDFLVFLNQKNNAYILEVLEPQGKDSFFNWNFLDAILQRKEGFSPYVFEEVAQRILSNDKSLNQEFKEKKEKDKEFAGNSYQQLDFIYSRSVHQDKDYKQYPIYRLMK